MSLKRRYSCKDVLGFVEVGVDVLPVPVEMGVVVEQSIESLPSVCGETGPVVELAHGIDQGSVVLKFVWMRFGVIREGDVLVPLIAEAAVAGVGLDGPL